LIFFLPSCRVKDFQTILSNIILKSKDKRVVHHNATVLETVVRPLETVRRPCKGSETLAH
jgi:hypothetical protein